MTRIALSFTVALAVCAGPLAAAGLVEDYQVNAQYRGGVKKGFQDIGSGKASYEPLGATAFRVKVKGQVRHPKEDKEYAFTVAQTFQVTGNTIQTTATEKKELNEATKPHERQVTEIMPFAYLARSLPAPSDTGGDRSRAFTFDGQSYTMRYADTDRNQEISLYRGNELLGKFFVLPERTGQFAKLEKFRLSLPSEDLVVSFVVSNTVAGR